MPDARQSIKPYQRIIFASGLWSHPHISDLEMDWTTLYCSPIELFARRKIMALGVRSGLCNSGNFRMALYDSRSSDLYPRSPLAATDITSVLALTAGDWDWINTTTTPNIEQGLYWIAIFCDTAYVVGVSGLRITQARVQNLNNPPGPLNNVPPQTGQANVGSLTLPDPVVITGQTWHYVVNLAAMFGEA